MNLSGLISFIISLNLWHVSSLHTLGSFNISVQRLLKTFSKAVETSINDEDLTDSSGNALNDEDVQV